MTIKLLDPEIAKGILCTGCMRAWVACFIQGTTKKGMMLCRDCLFDLGGQITGLLYERAASVYQEERAAGERP